MNSNEPDQIDMMSETELRVELRRVVDENIESTESILALSRALDETLSVIIEDAFGMSEKAVDRLEEVLEKHGAPKCQHCNEAYTASGGICGGCAGVQND